MRIERFAKAGWKKAARILPIRYGALKKQYDNLNKNYTDGQIVLGDTSVNEAILALESQIFESTKLLKKYVELCTSSEPEGKIKMRECLNNGDPVPEWAYNLLTDYYFKYKEFDESGTPMMSGAALKWSLEKEIYCWNNFQRKHKNWKIKEL